MAPEHDTDPLAVILGRLDQLDQRPYLPAAVSQDWAEFPSYFRMAIGRDHSVTWGNIPGRPGAVRLQFLNGQQSIIGEITLLDGREKPGGTA